MAEARGPKSLLDQAREIGARRWSLAASVFLLVLAAGVGLAAGLPSIYRATTTLLVEPQEGDSDHPSDTASRVQAAQEETLSRAPLGELVDRFQLYSNHKARAPQEALVERLRGDIRVDVRTPEGSDGKAITLVSLSYDNADPHTAADVANALADVFLGMDSKSRDESRTGTIAALERQLDLAKGRLNQQEKQYGSVLAQQAAVQQSGASERSVAKLTDDLRSLSESRERAGERRAALLKEIADATTQEGGPPTNPTTAKLQALRKELADLRQRFKDTYPDVIHVKAQIAELEREAAKIEPPVASESKDSRVATLNEALVDVDAEIESLREEEEGLRQDLTISRRKADAGPVYHAPRAPLETARDYETTKALYAALLKQLEEARINAGDSVRRASFRVLDKATPPLVPAAPSRVRLMIMGVGLALVLAAAAVAGAEHVDSTFHSADDVRSFTRVPVLGRIPDMPGSAEQSQRRRHAWALAALCLGGVLVVAEASYGFARTQERLTGLVSRGH
jgi:polysaccharide chain length determinant protein (PEP-CTERM system associated)